MGGNQLGVWGDGAALVVNPFPHLAREGLGFGDLGGSHFYFKDLH